MVALSDMDNGPPIFEEVVAVVVAIIVRRVADMGRDAGTNAPAATAEAIRTDAARDRFMFLLFVVSFLGVCRPMRLFVEKEIDLWSCGCGGAWERNSKNFHLH